mmetsp:Transcript_6673/g.5987  ORF Transcript_6673/g.5987 Transcript_6673/m.5987 type:complete len:205 (-) Transcript_6673:1604-2218(-)
MTLRLFCTISLISVTLSFVSSSSSLSDVGIDDNILTLSKSVGPLTASLVSMLTLKLVPAKVSCKERLPIRLSFKLVPILSVAELPMVRTSPIFSTLVASLSVAELLSIPSFVSTTVSSSPAETASLSSTKCMLGESGKIVVSIGDSFWETIFSTGKGTVSLSNKQLSVKAEIKLSNNIEAITSLPIDVGFKSLVVAVSLLSETC